MLAALLPLALMAAFALGWIARGNWTAYIEAKRPRGEVLDFTPRSSQGRRQW